MITKSIERGMDVHIIVYVPDTNNVQELLFETDTLDNDYFKKLDGTAEDNHTKDNESSDDSSND
jgi:hypothetical protein